MKYCSFFEVFQPFENIENSLDPGAVMFQYLVYNIGYGFRREMIQNTGCYRFAVG